MPQQKCPTGTIKRKSYNVTRNSKTIHVPSSCIKPTSYTGLKRTSIDKKKLASKKKSHERVNKKYPSVKCKKNEVLKTGYRKKSFRRSHNNKSIKVKSSSVKPTCIPKRGSGSGYKIPLVLNKNDLAQFGYHEVKDLTKMQRQQALTKAYNEYKKPLSIYRKLNVLSTLNKNTNKKSSKIFKEDAEWFKQKFGISQ
ncbi:hypothetical protein Hokovirus_3_84 [Hokovirus HKV1]|uniref:Uncharacterized protein n=1 Tax=Hokovirus HKV1 TaxID=1977638 RepID=A0A1V0SGL2_9VIRU|nr:hypothetical protein Hokovirus_3_84 [Hokovirus HKV1]